MKPLFTTTALLLLTSLPAFAAVLETDSTITAATVFPEGATITRTADFDAAAAGRHQIVIADLPLGFDPTSLRATGTGSADFRIVSVDHRIRRLPPRSQTDSPAYRALDAERAELEDQQAALMFDIAALDLKIEVADGRLHMVETLIAREAQPTTTPTTAATTTAADLGATIGVLAEQMEIALLAKLSAEREKADLHKTITDVVDKIAKVKQQMAATQLPARDTSEATIDIIADTALRGTLQLAYRTHAAGWAPLYDLRLTQGDTDEFAVERHARIYQSTGEAWDDVALTLSTARPSLRMDAPMFASQIATLWDPNAIAPLSRSHAQGDMAMESVQAIPAPAARNQATPEAATFETRGRTVVYKITSPADIDGDGTVRQLFIDAATTPVDTSARATPRLDPTAYLYATFQNSFDGPILPGQASTYVDGAFIGQSRLPFTAADAELDLPFGALDGITVQTDITDRLSGDFGILSTTKTQNEAYEFTITSVLGDAMPLTIYDRVPVSENEDLVVDVKASPPASAQNAHGVRGLTAWTFEIAGNSTQAISFGYEISWPGDMALNLSSGEGPVIQDGSGAFR